MRIFNYAIIGSGMSAFIVSLRVKNSVLFTNYSKVTKIFKSQNFYEYKNIGGNSNIWGAYINLKKLNSFFKKNKKFYKFIKNNKYFTVARISNLKCFNNIGYLKNKKNDKILRLNKSFFKKINFFDLEKIQIKKNYVYLYSKRKILKAKKVNLCIGNFGLIKVLKNSNLIKDTDIITYEDGKVNYFLNFFLNFNKYYYIPMSIKQIFQKLFFKSIFYNIKDNNRNLLVQAFSKKFSVFRFSVKELLFMKKRFHRGLITNHVANLRINNIPIQDFIAKSSSSIFINCSGNCKKYIPGSISQDIIYNAYLNS